MIIKPNIIKTIAGGIAATLLMSIVTFVAPIMGLPKMNPAEMLSGMLNIPVELGWVMHFMIGIIFAVVYGQLLIKWLHNINGRVWKGVILGFAVFMFAQVMMLILGTMMPMPKMDVSMMLMMIGSLIGHLVYGLTVAFIVAEKDFRCRLDEKRAPDKSAISLKNSFRLMVISYF
jgi:uncharacterized membrane protein YagU involved in acid resistance